MKAIHTLNARGNVMLEVMRDDFNLSPQVMHREIQGMRNQIETVLAAKDIQYDALKTALVPDRKRREIALFFDTTKIEESWYGLPVFQSYFPLLDKRSSHSVLDGDYIDTGVGQDVLYEALREELAVLHPVTFQHSSLFYIIYINNLTDAMFVRLTEGLATCDVVAGYADMTYASRLKWLLSTMLVNSYIKHGKIILQGHEDDRDDGEDVNMSSYPFEDFGYVCRSVQSRLEGVLLSYKIERPVSFGFEVDTEFSLNSVVPSPLPVPIYDFEIEISDDKFGYLRTEKYGSLQRAGLEGVGARELKTIIRKKISSSYIYNLVHLQKHNTTKFNVIVELRSADGGKPTRLLAALAYEADRRTLRLLTLY